MQLLVYIKISMFCGFEVVNRSEEHNADVLFTIIQ